MNVREGLSRDAARLIIWFPFRWAVGTLPFRLACRLFELLGDFHAAVLAGGPRRIAVNFASARLPEAARKGFLREYLRNHYVDRLHIFTYPVLSRMSRYELDRAIVLDGEARIGEALGVGKGVILLQPHFGPVQLPLFALAAAGFKLTQVALLHDDGLSVIGRTVAFERRRRLESLLPAEFVTAGSFVRPLFRALGRGECVLMSGDGTGGGKFIGEYAELPFLGQVCRVPVGPYHLAALTGAAVLPCFLERLGTGRYRFRIGAPLLFGTPMEGAREFLSRFEAVLAVSPGMWHFWDEFEVGRIRSGSLSPTSVSIP